MVRHVVRRCLQTQPPAVAQRDDSGAEVHRPWACASINAAVCASNPPSLYVATSPSQAEPKCLTKALTKRQEHVLRTNRRLPVKWRKAFNLREVLDHPLLTLLNQVNPVHNSFDLWELTTLYQEVHGSAYWYLDIGPLGIPQAI